MDARGDRPQKDPLTFRTSPRGPTSSLTETPSLSAPNVSYCVEAHSFRVILLEEMYDSAVLLCKLTR